MLKRQFFDVDLHEIGNKDGIRKELGGFQIAMNNLVAMQIVHPLANLLQPIGDFFLFYALTTVVYPRL